MELRIDRLLEMLRNRPEELLAAIDRDPLLVKREVSGLVLANASKELFTPQEVHHLFAKGIVYRRAPYQLVSLPLLKIYNLGERNVTWHHLAEMLANEARVHFLRKFDGTMIQRFQHDGKVWFSTRGMLEGAYLPSGEAQDDEAPAHANSFDYIGTARRIAEDRYPALASPIAAAENITLVLELIHPEARVITDYRGRVDLVLLAAYDRARHAYWSVDRLRQFAADHHLAVTDALTPHGATIAEQIDSLLASLAGTDEEGAVLVFERDDEVIYRVKIKTPDYLRLLRLTVRCNYGATVEMLDAMPQFPTWTEFEAVLQAQGSESVPEEVLGLYREHYDTFVAYREGCQVLQAWAIRRAERLLSTIPAAEPRARRKAFADVARREPHSALLFAALDDRLTIERLRQYVSTPTELTEALSKIAEASS